MDSKHLKEFIKKYKKRILLFGIVGLFLGFIVYAVFPQKYVATGLLFVTRSLDSKQELGDFSYEGFYAQQNSANYTSTVIGLLESETLHKAVLQQQGVPVTRDSLRKLGRSTSVKKKAPQLILVSVLGITQEETSTTWGLLTDEIVKTGDRLNDASDPSLYIVKVTDVPLVKETYSNVVVNMIVGFGLGLLVGTFTFAFLTYVDPKA